MAGSGSIIQRCGSGDPDPYQTLKLSKNQIYLSDNVDAEVESLEALHAEEGAGEDFLDEVPAEVQVLQGAQVLQVHVSNRLNKQKH